MSIQYKTLIALLTLCMVDAVIPLPIIGAILIYVVVQKPAWFVDLANQIYKARP